MSDANGRHRSTTGSHWIDGERPAEPQIESHSMGVFAAENKTPYPPIIDGLFRAGEIVNCIGSTKEGKSWLMLGMMLSIAQGVDWMGRPTKSGPIMLVDNELQDPTLAHRITATRKAMGVDVETLCDSCRVITLRHNPHSLAELVPTLIREIQTYGVTVLGLDAFYRFLGGDTELDSSAMTRLYASAIRIAGETGCAVVFNHHATKGDQGGKSVTDMGSGAGAISRAADTHLVIRPHQLATCAVLEGACRSFPSPDPVTIQWEYPLWLPKPAIEPELHKDDVRVGRHQEQAEADGEVSSALACIGSDGGTVGQVADLVSFGKDKAKNTLNRLVNAGKAKREQRVRGGRPGYIYWLASETEENGSETGF